MKARLRALIRLFTLQASYTYERLQGTGIAVAQEPLLEPLGKDSERAAAARARSAQYFNAHPFLAGIAVGALSRAELAGEEGNRILRLRTALSGPLGALGDQLFWAGIVPAIMALALLAATVGWGTEALIGVVIGYNVCRFLITDWGLRLGLTYGSAVAGELSHSRLRDVANGAGAVAALGIGLAVPGVAQWLLTGSRGAGSLTGLLLLLAGAAGFGVLTRKRHLPIPLLVMIVSVVILLLKRSVA
ncbi:MAG: PTS system mannose/fructose/sorbose family transporter subunit IID [Gemmatimonadales bacterium]